MAVYRAPHDLLPPDLRGAYLALALPRRDPRSVSRGPAKFEWLLHLPHTEAATEAFAAAARARIGKKVPGRASTASEARALVKAALGLSRLPVGTKVVKVVAK